jgi:hypothetical protein
MKKFRVVFAKFRGSCDFQDLWNYFPKEKSIEYVHNTVDRIHRCWLTGLRTSLNAGRWFLDRRLRLNQVNRYLCSLDAGLPLALHSRCKSHPVPIRRLRRLAPVGGGIGSRSRWCVAAERGGSPEFEFSRATVVIFWWGLLLRNHIDEGNVFMLTLIGGEWQRSPAMVKRLDRCLSTVRTASSDASAPRLARAPF